jgi:hypothetical protein
MHKVESGSLIGRGQKKYRVKLPEDGGETR